MIRMLVVRPFLLEGKRVEAGEMVDVPGKLVAYLMGRGVVREVPVFLPDPNPPPSVPPEGGRMAGPGVTDQAGGMVGPVTEAPPNGGGGMMGAEQMPPMIEEVGGGQPG